MIENVNQNASRTYQVNRFLEVVVVFVHAIIVVWTPLPLKFCVIFQNVTTHKPRFKWTYINGISKDLTQSLVEL